MAPGECNLVITVNILLKSLIRVLDDDWKYA